MTNETGHGRWLRTFLGLLLLNTLLLCAALSVRPTSLWSRPLLTASVLANLPGIVTSMLVIGDETDERFGLEGSVATVWGFSLPWLAIGALIIEDSRKRWFVPQEAPSNNEMPRTTSG